jgi:hypothetical protein
MNERMTSPLHYAKFYKIAEQGYSFSEVYFEIYPHDREATAESCGINDDCENSGKHA